jgi:hypothetical protein
VDELMTTHRGFESAVGGEALPTAKKTPICEPEAS